MRHRPLATALLACAAANAQAAPFAIRHEGFIDTATLSGVNSGESFSVTLVFDNGGTSTAGQAWQAPHLTCIIWRFNNAQNAVYAQSLPGTAPDVAGQAATNGSGGLTSTFSLVAGTGNVGQYNTANLPTLAAPAQWVVNASQATVLHSNNGEQVTITGLGITAIPGYWTPPARVTGPCDDTAYAAPPAATPVPTLGHGALVLLAGMLAALGGRRRLAHT